MRQIKLSGMKKSEILYKELKKRLVRSNPGEKFMTVRSIMNKYDCSQATISSALKPLREEGLISINGHRNMIVTDAVLRYRKGAKPVYYLAMPHWSSDYFFMLEQVFWDQASKLGYEPEILRYDWHQNVPLELPQVKIDGMIVLPGAANVGWQDIEQLNKFGVPFLVFGVKLSGLQVNTISLDDEYSGALAASHLHGLGHRHIAVIRSEPKSDSIEARIKGFCQFAELHDSKVDIIDCNIHSGDDAINKVYKKMKDMFAAGKTGFSGVFVVSESPGLGVYKACYESGVSIPRDLSVVVAGEQWWLDYQVPPLTSIGIDHAIMIREATNILAKSKDCDYSHKLIKAQLTARKSTDHVVQ